MAKKNAASSAKKKDIDPNPGASRIVASASKVPSLSEFLEKISKHVPNPNGILKLVDECCKKGSVSEKIKVDRARALDLLSRNVENNRKFKWQTVIAYADLMARKRWTYNGNSIKFTREGELIDCQKRLAAIVLSDTVQEFVIAGGLSRESINTIDTGQIRSAEDALRIAGIKTHPGMMAAAIKKVILYGAIGKVAGNVRNASVTIQAVIDWISDPEVEAKVLASFVEIAITELHRDGDYLTASEWAFMWYTLYRRPGKQEKARFFVNALCHGEKIDNDGPTRPIIHLRKLLQKWDGEYSSGKSTAQSLSLKFNYIFKAWNIWVTNKWQEVDPKRGIILDRETRESRFVIQPL